MYVYVYGNMKETMRKDKDWSIKKIKIGIERGSSYRKNEEIFRWKTQTHRNLNDTFQQ